MELAGCAGIPKAGLILPQAALYNRLSKLLVDRRGVASSNSLVT